MSLIAVVLVAVASLAVGGLVFARSLRRHLAPAPGRGGWERLAEVPGGELTRPLVAGAAALAAVALGLGVPLAILIT